MIYIKLTKREREVLQKMQEGEDLVYETGGGWWIGDEPTNGKLAIRLIAMAVISQEEYCGEGVERYYINGTGKRLLETGELKYEF